MKSHSGSDRNCNRNPFPYAPNFRTANIPLPIPKSFEIIRPDHKITAVFVALAIDCAPDLTPGRRRPEPFFGPRAIPSSSEGRASSQQLFFVTPHRPPHSMRGFHKRSMTGQPTASPPKQPFFPPKIGPPPPRGSLRKAPAAAVAGRAATALAFSDVSPQSLLVAYGLAATGVQPCGWGGVCVRYGEGKDEGRNFSPTQCVIFFCHRLIRIVFIEFFLNFSLKIA